MTQNVDSRLLSGVYVLHSGIKAAIQARERGFTQQHLTQNLRFKDVTWGGTNQNPHYWAKNEGFGSFQGGGAVRRSRVAPHVHAHVTEWHAARPKNGVC